MITIEIGGRLLAAVCVICFAYMVIKSGGNK